MIQQALLLSARRSLHTVVTASSRGLYSTTTTIMTNSPRAEWATPRTEIPFNFGRASSRDTTLYTCERPGGDPSGDVKISIEQVLPQIEFMKQEGISDVLILLDDNELFEHYETPDLLLNAYQTAGIVTHRQPMGEPGAPDNIFSIIKKCFASQQEDDSAKIAAHCTHGMGRSGRVAAAWLTEQYQLDPNEATEEVMEYARQHGIERLSNTEKLSSWLRG